MESCTSCPGDCGSCPIVCGRYGCQAPSETCLSCTTDCPDCLNDGSCSPELGENCFTSPTDCAPCPEYCGNSVCDPSETSATCPLDCNSCGNGACEGNSGENCENCPGDCGACPACTQQNADTVCLNALPAIQQNCTLYYCDPKENHCTYDAIAYQGKPCGNERAPYSDECHVDVCMRGFCVYDAPIDSSNPASAGGLPPLTTTNHPWLRGVCEFNATANDFSYAEYEIHPFCGYWGCEAGETQANCCEDCGCPLGEICSLGSCTSIGPPIPATCGSPATCDSGEDYFNCPGDCPSFENWIPLAAIALIFGYLLAALIYMASHVISSPELEAWSKNELYEVSVSAMFLGSAVFFVGLLTAVSVQLIGVDYYTAANDYVNLLSAELLRVYGLLVKGIFAMGLLGYVGADLSLPIVVTGIVNFGMSGSIYPFGGMGLLSNTLVMFSNILSFAIILTIGQKVMLDFIMQVGFRILLPISIVLRSFTFTRKLGATLMAIAIGAYIIYPITLVMNAQIYASVPKIPQTEYQSSALPLDNFNMGPWMDIFLGPNFGKYCAHWYDWLWMCWLFAIFAWVLSFIKAIFGAFVFIMQVVAGILRLGAAEVTAQGFDYYVHMIPWAMQPVTAAFLFPVLDLIIVITAMRSLSEAIGGESRITGLAQFI